jgi:hypothetical protein
MAASSKIGDLSAAINLIVQPLVLESLQAIADGKSLEDALSADTDAVALDAAVQRLAAIGAIYRSIGGVLGRHTLTRRGTYLLRLLDDLEGLVPASEMTRRYSEIC